MANEENITQLPAPQLNVAEVGVNCDAVLINGEREMLINAWGNLGVAEYQGSRAQLEAEGVIPIGLEWPHKTEDRRWQIGDVVFWLSRCRPPGLKGPMNLWTTGDWWRFRWNPIKTDFSAMRIKQKAKEIAQIIHHQSPRGIEEFNLMWSRLSAAHADRKYQVFKELMPCLQHKKSGRRPKQKDKADSTS